MQLQKSQHHFPFIAMMNMKFTCIVLCLAKGIAKFPSARMSLNSALANVAMYNVAILFYRNQTHELVLKCINV
jgi:hypothetical protein